MGQQTDKLDSSSGHLLRTPSTPDLYFFSNDLSLRFRRPYIYIMTCAHAFTVAAMTALAVQWRVRPWLQRISDLTVCLACISWRQPNLPLLLPSFAVAYTVWTSLPGSLSTMNLPSHSKFMRQLEVVKAAGEQDACGVCWDDGQELAKLPCNHLCCRRCLQSMGAHFQTACPFCRRPLFSNYDRLVFVFSKGSVTCTTLNTLLSLAQVVFQIRHAHYLDADTLLPLATMCTLGGYLAFSGALIRRHERNWWRLTPGAIGRSTMSLNASGFACLTGTFLLWQTFWKTNKLAL